MKNIVIIGFMGVGKGSVAREIIQHSEYMALDTDDLIESMENKKIKNIFADSGEAYFRSLETKIARWCENSVSDTLISTGGGFFKQKNIKKIGKIVLLDASFDTIYGRIINHPNAQKKLKKRPLFQDIKKAKALYDERRPQYLDVADLVIDVSAKDYESIAKEILKKI